MDYLRKVPALLILTFLSFFYEMKRTGITSTTGFSKDPVSYPVAWCLA